MPAKIFASSASDWFHEKLRAEDIATLYAVAVAAVHLRKHTIQILTKRSGRMREILNSEAFWEQVNAEASAHVLERVDPLDRRRRDDARATLGDYGPGNPPPGVWLGVSCEDQTRADERVPDLLASPAAVRFVSAEPLLGAIDLTRIARNGLGLRGDALRWPGMSGPSRSFGNRLDWLIVGGESGPRARPMRVGAGLCAVRAGTAAADFS